MLLKNCPAHAAALLLAWVLLLLSQTAAAEAVSVEDVDGAPGEDVTVGLFVDGLTLTPVSGSFPFDLGAVLQFSSDLTLKNVVLQPSTSPAIDADIFWPLGPNDLGPNNVGFLATYDTDPGPFMNAEMLRLTFSIDPGADPGPYPISVMSSTFSAAMTVPLPPALALYVGSLALLAMYRRRT